MVATSTDFIYVSDGEGTDDSVYGYSVNTQTGALTAITGSPFTTGLTAPPQGLASDPLGKFLYVTQANNNQIAGFTIGSNGALTPMAGSPFNTGDTYPSAIVVDSAGAFLYASNNQSVLGSISGFSIAPTSGTLTPVTGSPFTTLVNGGPTNLAVSPKSSFLYVPLAGTTSPLSSIFAYSFDSTGVLSQIPGTPFTVGTQPIAAIVDPSGKYLYSADFGGNDISAFTIDSSSGALTAISGSPFAASPNPDSLAINASSSLLFATSGTSTSIFAFTINSSGALTAVAPLNGGGTPGGLAIIHKE
jgi:6-phosphogluconolactonase (cycloisomerase 2 family)